MSYDSTVDPRCIRNKNITLVYKNLLDGTLHTEQLKGRTEEEYNLIANAMSRGFSDKPYLYLHRREGDQMKTVSVDLLKVLGTASKRTLHNLIYLEYVIDPDVV